MNIKKIVRSLAFITLCLSCTLKPDVASFKELLHTSFSHDALEAHTETQGGFLNADNKHRLEELASHLAQLIDDSSTSLQNVSGFNESIQKLEHLTNNVKAFLDAMKNDARPEALINEIQQAIQKLKDPITAGTIQINDLRAKGYNGNKAIQTVINIKKQLREKLEKLSTSYHINKHALNHFDSSDNAIIEAVTHNNANALYEFTPKTAAVYNSDFDGQIRQLQSTAYELAAAMSIKDLSDEQCLCLGLEVTISISMDSLLAK